MYLGAYAAKGGGYGSHDLSGAGPGVEPGVGFVYAYDGKDVFGDCHRPGGYGESGEPAGTITERHCRIYADQCGSAEHCQGRCRVPGPLESVMDLLWLLVVVFVALAILIVARRW